MTSYFKILISIVLIILLIGVVSPVGTDVLLLRDSESPLTDAIYGELAAGGWLWQYVVPGVAAINDVLTPLAPMGIASYGVMEVGGRYFAYVLTTDAVKGVIEISPNISVSGYWKNGAYYGQAFTVQLNAFVVAGLKDGTMQYYWVQNVVQFDEKQKGPKGLKVWNNIWNMSDKISVLGKPNMRLIPAAVRGNGAVYDCSLCHGGLYYYDTPDIIPIGRVELEMWVRVSNGEIIVEFYANGQKYDEVIITPYAPASSAHITIAPTTTPTGHPLNLELIFGGYNAIIPYAILERGWIGLELYIRANDSWIPPPSAWSIGYITVETAYAHVEPKGVGSVIVKPGAPNSRQLWAGTVVVTPFGIDITTSTDLSSYTKRVDLNNNTRLILAEVYINGRPAQSLSYVPLGSFVEFRYACQPHCNITTTANDKGIALIIGMALAFTVFVKSLKRLGTDSP